MNELSVAQPEQANAGLWRRLCAHNGSHAGDITGTKAEHDVNATNIVSFYPQLTFA